MKSSALFLLISITLNLFFSQICTAQVNSFVIDSSKFKVALLPILDTIYKDDQSYRVQLSELKKKNAAENEISAVSSKIKSKDSINLIKVKEILHKHGWLGPQEVGMNGSQALFLVIQHADLQTQKTYIDLIRKAEKDGKTFSSNLAILEDRIAMREGRKQLYGSQGFKDKVTNKNYIYPIDAPDQLDERRKAMGMPPMSTYITDWNLEHYKKDLPNIERIVKEQNIK